MDRKAKIENYRLSLLNKLSNSTVEDDLLQSKISTINIFQEDCPDFQDFRLLDNYNGWFGSMNAETFYSTEVKTCFTVTFNRLKHSWDYSWKSNRWAGHETMHVIEVYVFEHKNKYLRILHNICSPSFKVICSHKSVNSKLKVAQTSESSDGITNSNSLQGSQLKRSHTDTEFDNKNSVSSGNTSDDNQLDEVKRLRINGDISNAGDNNLPEQIDNDDIYKYLDTKNDQINLMNMNSLVNQSCYIYDVQRRLEVAGLLLNVRTNGICTSDSSKLKKSEDA